jgi:hypothetical protein
MYSYQFATGGTFTQIVKTYYIIGSNDNSTWYPIQYGLVNAQPVSSASTLIPGTIIVNSASSQSFGTSTTITTTTYSTTTNAYIYFRLLTMSNFSSTASYMEIAEWAINFSTPTPLLTAPATAPSTATSAVTVTPNMTNLTAPTDTTVWTTPNGVTWKATATSTYIGNNPTNYAGLAFNGLITGGQQSWASGGTYVSGVATTSPLMSGVITSSGTINIRGEALQLQSSVPLVMNSYSYGVAGTVGYTPRTYYILGSNDATTWYNLHYASTSANPFGTTTNIALTTYINVNFTGAQTLSSAGAASTTTTTTATQYNTNAYTYFRFIADNVYSGTILELSEWYINFTAYTPNPVNTLAISNGGQNMLVAATGTTMPNSTSATSNSWTANGVNWIASASSAVNAAVWPIYAAFNTMNNTVSWNSGNFYNSQTGAYGGSTSTSITGQAAQTGEFLQLQSSAPLVLYNYSIATGGSWQMPKAYWIVGSNDGLTWYPIQSGTFAANPYNTNFSSSSNYIIANNASAQTYVGNVSTTVTTVIYAPYTTQAYSYFRMIIQSMWGAVGNTNAPNNDSVSICEWFVNFQAGATYLSSNYGSTWSTAATAPPTAPFLATSGNGQYTITGSGQLATVYSNATLTAYTIPTLTGINANINCASVSSTGQYMIIMTQGTTNNVFYSTNFGITFTGMNVGSAPMTSCAISYDGFEITVSNAANVYTLNRNTQGYSITMGNQSGLTNQGYNSIAIGNLAGVTNQSANSVILNASGTTLDAYNPGFFVSPVQSQLTANQSSVALLGYGADGQVVQSSPVVLSNGNVGIGITNPPWPLSLIGNNFSCLTGTNVSATMTIAGNYGNAGISQGIAGGYIEGGTNYFVNTYMAFGTNGGSGGPGISKLESIRIVTNGNVGIGKTTPSSALDITGNLYVNNGVAATVVGQYQGIQMYYTGTGSTGYGSIIATNPGSTYNPVCLNPSGGNVGIGNTNPRDTLHTTAGGTSIIRISTSSNGYASQLVFDPVISGYWHISGYGNVPTASARGQAYGAGMILVANESGNNYEDSYMAFWTCHDPRSDGVGGLGVLTERMRLSSLGYLSIGTGTASYQLTLSLDSAGKPTSSTWIISSDERIKENIVLADVDRCVEIIRAVPLKHYRWKDEVYTQEQVKDRSKLGWIAQDVKKVFPKAVGTQRLAYNQVYEDVVSENGLTEKKLISEDVIEDCLDLNVDQMYAVMYGAIQKLITENDSKTSQISAQAEKIVSLESQLTAQASQLTSQTQQLSAQTAELTSQASQLSEVLSRLAALESKS